MNIDKIFKQTLSNRRVNANPDIFNKIEAGLNASASSGSVTEASQSATAIMGGAAKIVIVGISIATLAIGGYFIDSINDKAEQPLTSAFIEKDMIKEKVSEPIVEQPIIQAKNDAVKTEHSTLNTDFGKQITDPIQNEIEIEFSNPQKSNTTAISQNYETNIDRVTTKESNTYAAISTSPVQTPKNHLQQTDISNLSDKLQIPNVITPNGDGINECFVIGNLEIYPDNVLVIWNRAGKQIFSASHYQNNWNAQNLPQGTYIYKLLLKTGNEKEIKAGIIEVIR